MSVRLYVCVQSHGLYVYIPEDFHRPYRYDWFSPVLVPLL